MNPACNVTQPPPSPSCSQCTASFDSVSYSDSGCVAPGSGPDTISLWVYNSTNTPACLSTSNPLVTAQIKQACTTCVVSATPYTSFNDNSRACILEGDGSTWGWAGWNIVCGTYSGSNTGH
jgi:hypothetical protein